jgi:hypothetical protein
MTLLARSLRSRMTRFMSSQVTASKVLCKKVDGNSSIKFTSALETVEPYDLDWRWEMMEFMSGFEPVISLPFRGFQDTSPAAF